MRYLFVAVTLVVTGCAPGRYAQLPSEDQDRFQRCSEAMYPAMCGHDRDTVYRTMCLRNNLATYADVPSEDLRKQWLAGRGCPPAMIEPGAWVGR